MRMHSHGIRISKFNQLFTKTFNYHWLSVYQAPLSFQTAKGWSDLHLCDISGISSLPCLFIKSQSKSHPCLSPVWARCNKVYKGARHQRAEIQSVPHGVKYFVLSVLVKSAKYLYSTYSIVKEYINININIYIYIKYCLIVC